MSLREKANRFFACCRSDIPDQVVVPGCTRNDLVGELARQQFIMSRPAITCITMLKTFSNAGGTETSMAAMTMKRVDPQKAAANAFYKWRHQTRKHQGILLYNTFIFYTYKKAVGRNARKIKKTGKRRRRRKRRGKKRRRRRRRARKRRRRNRINPTATSYFNNNFGW